MSDANPYVSMETNARRRWLLELAARASWLGKFDVAYRWWQSNTCGSQKLDSGLGRVAHLVEFAPMAAAPRSWSRGIVH